jgi:S1-C subfamily serine protease
MKTALSLSILLRASTLFASTHRQPQSQQPVAMSPAQVFEFARKSIVEIVTYTATGQPLMQRTGCFFTSDGQVLTNYHVIEGQAPSGSQLTMGVVIRVER